MAVEVSIRRMANTVLVVVGAFLIGGVFHRTFVTGEGELLAPTPVFRILLGAAIIVVAYLVRVPREERMPRREPDDAGDEDA